MELVYLWVEEYKNIHKQGFNFSPRFHCDYDSENKELTIKDKPEYIEKFFGDNINVTAIVGKNGSGKSSVLELLLILFYGNKEANIEKTNKAWIIMYDRDGKYFSTKSWSREDKILFDDIIRKNTVLDRQIKDDNGQVYISNADKPKKKYYNIAYTSAPELMSSSFFNYNNHFKDNIDKMIYSRDNKPLNIINITLLPNREKSIIDIKKNENIDMLNMFNIQNSFSGSMLKKVLKKLNTKKLYFIPSKIKLVINYENLASSMTNDNFNQLLGEDENISDLVFLYRYLIWQIMSYSLYDNMTDKFNEYFLINDELSDFFEQKIKNINDRNNKVSMVTQNILNNINMFIEFTQNINLSKSMNENSKRLKNDVLETANLIEIIKEIGNKNIFDILIDDITMIEKILPNLPSYITLEVEDEYGAKFNDFSYGEKRIINLIYSILYYVDFYNMDNTLINLFLDEIDLGFHPEWQKNIFDIIINIFLEYKIDIRIVLLTHSPFLLSDIPKQNIIFLDTDEAGKCKVVDGLKEKKQTFGANIHTLLSDSFFMEDGLMGEFAKGKIDKAITLLNQEHLSDEELKYCEQIISIIGEPIVKNQLQRMLDSKRLEKIDEIDAIKSSMEAMQKRLDELEK